MTTLPAPIADAERAVSAWKPVSFDRVQAAILQRALVKTYVSPADIPEDIVDDADRQGVASNAWNRLAALGLLVRLPLTVTIAALNIFGGRTRNTNPKAKGRWVAVYQLVSRSLAEEWLRRHGHPTAPPPAPAQGELTLTGA